MYKRRQSWHYQTNIGTRPIARLPQQWGSDLNPNWVFRCTRKHKKTLGVHYHCRSRTAWRHSISCQRSAWDWDLCSVMYMCMQGLWVKSFSPHKQFRWFEHSWWYCRLSQTSGQLCLCDARINCISRHSIICQIMKHLMKNSSDNAGQMPSHFLLSVNFSKYPKVLYSLPWTGKSLA